MKLILLVAAGALALGASACSGGGDCTPEALQKKSQEVTKAIQEKISGDPSKLQELMGKMQELAKKYQSSVGDQSEACKAYDELLTTIKS